MRFLDHLAFDGAYPIECLLFGHGAFEGVIFVSEGLNEDDIAPLVQILNVFAERVVPGYYVGRQNQKYLIVLYIDVSLLQDLYSLADGVQNTQIVI